MPGRVSLLRRMLVAVAVIAVLGFAGWYGLHWIPADFSYRLETEFATVPADDEPLSDWVRSQPGVWLANVQRQPVGERWRVEILFGITQNAWQRQQPPLPDLDAAAASLGYSGPSGRFKDSPR